MFVRRVIISIYEDVMLLVYVDSLHFMSAVVAVCSSQLCMLFPTSCSDG